MAAGRTASASPDAPPLLPYREGVPVPSGYTLVDRPATGLITAGVIGLGISYATGVIIAASQGFDNGTALLILPVLGPYAAIATREYACEVDTVAAAKKCTADETQIVTLMAVDGLAQTAGALVAVAGLMSGTKELVRSDLPEVTVTPPVSARSGWQFSVRGDFLSNWDEPPADPRSPGGNPMTTRIVSTGPDPLVASTPTQARTTPQPTRPFQQVMGAGASAVVMGAEAAVRRLPGGPILAAAFRPGPAGAPPGVATTAEGIPLSSGGTGSPESPASTPATNDPSVEGMLAENGDKNLYYIALQERISAENRMYTAYSNVLRVRHETMKNAIGNFR